jgi:hypothetical protein
MMHDMSGEVKEQRTWVYVQQPREYEIALHTCGDKTPEWSEFKDHLWCGKCQVDFVPEHWGIFEGPVPVNACKMLGISFDRFNLETGVVEPFVIEEKRVG